MPDFNYEGLQQTNQESAFFNFEVNALDLGGNEFSILHPVLPTQLIHQEVQTDEYVDQSIKHQLHAGKKTFI